MLRDLVLTRSKPIKNSRYSFNVFVVYILFCGLRTKTAIAKLAPNSPLNINGDIMTGRRLHLFATMWTFVFASLHLGIHFSFKFLEYGESVIKFLFDYVCVICLICAVEYYSNKVILLSRKKKKTGAIKDLSLAGELCNTERV